MPKKQEEELPVSDEIKQRLLHHMLVKLRKVTDGIDPRDVADGILAVPTADLAAEETTVVSWRMDNVQTTVRIPGWLSEVLDRAAAYYGVSRNRLITDALYELALPQWLSLMTATDEDMRGSLWLAFRNLDTITKRMEYYRRAEKSVGPLMEETRSLIASGEHGSAAEMFLEVVDNINLIENSYWRKRIAAEAITDYERVQMILTILHDEEIPGVDKLEEAVVTWRKEIAE